MARARKKTCFISAPFGFDASPVPGRHPVAATGIAGTPGTLTEAYFEISAALAKGRRILVINRADILSFRHTDEIVEFLKLKILELTTLGTSR
jgi:hypothetical protein